MSRHTELAGWNPLDWPLTTGVIPYLVLAVGWAALLGLAYSRSRHWWSRRLPCAVVLAAALTVLLRFVVDDWWVPFPEGLPRASLFWIGVAVLGLCLAAFRLPPLRWRGRAVAVLAAALVVLMASSQINRQFDQYPTLRVLLAPWIGKTDALTTGQVPAVHVPEGKTLAEVWQAPAGLPAKGTVSTTPIPGVRSGFSTSDAYVYLPPAYQANPRPLLPVLVMLTGQPGTSADWVGTGQLPEQMDAFAAAHGGLAPIVLMIAQNGSSEWGNSLCMNSRIAQAQTYLAQDVPDWAHTHLQTATGRKSTMIGGLSQGGTCSLQLAVNAPEVFGTFLDISGQEEPTLGSRQDTVQKAFGGDEAAFDAVDPLQVMARKKFPDTAAAFVVGDGDGEYGPQQRKVYQAALAAGMQAHFQTVPGGHAWSTFRAGLGVNLPWLAQQAGVIR
ncbi:alpha/beta hydrolase [Kitasatospora sp. NPDC101801]|uniref:alpha/beta hydrolase n=1 Tax=Kitasatospora sp. NPDC101801 TaxID=3364103 RepID=UPI00381A2EEA